VDISQTRPKFVFMPKAPAIEDAAIGLKKNDPHPSNA
jgi:hypothetical protein